MNEDEISTVLLDVKEAWKAACNDYTHRALNSERCLQAALYFHLRKRLEERSGYVIFIEAKVRLPAQEDEPESEIIIDTLICNDWQILVAIELKYAPRVIPAVPGIRKDLRSLSRIRNHREKIRRVEIEIARHHETAVDNRVMLTIHPRAKMLLGIICRFSETAWTASKFFSTYKPESGPWAHRARGAPPRLGLCLGYTPETGGQEPLKVVFLGQPFEANGLAEDQEEVEIQAG